MPKHKHDSASTLSGLYELPRIYDILHIPGTQDDANGLFQIADKFVQLPADPRGSWLEPACGSGRFVLEAARRGVHALGVDLNKGMIRFARKMTPLKLRKRARFRQGDICHLETMCKPESVDFAFNPINTIRHLSTDREMLQHFHGIATILRKGGVYIVGLSLSAYGVEAEAEDRWEGASGKTRVIQNVQYLPAPGGSSRKARMEHVISHLTILEGKKERHIDDSYWLRSYDMRQWLMLIERSHLRLIETIDEHGRSLPPAEPGYTIFVLARKDDPRATTSRWHPPKAK